MKRRDFPAWAAGSAAALSGAFPAAAEAATAPLKTGEYRRLPAALKPATPGTIEVIEFFWYGCPHCRTFESDIESWAARPRAPGVVYRKVHVAFRAIVKRHQQLFYALQAMGAAHEAAMRTAIFDALHARPERLATVDDMAAFLDEQAGTRATPRPSAAFKDAYGSFDVSRAMGQATVLEKAYELPGVPAVGIGGRFLTAPSMTGGNRRCIEVIDHLVALARREA